VRSGVSVISAKQACENAESEIPDFDLITVANAARAQWNGLLRRVEVKIAHGQEDLRILFYSSVGSA
jgi:putative alpha-1,2-mannosidase